MYDNLIDRIMSKISEAIRFKSYYTYTYVLSVWINELHIMQSHNSIKEIYARNIV